MKNFHNKSFKHILVHNKRAKVLYPLEI